MICALRSYPPDYSKLKTNINIPWETKYVKYFISEFNTMSNIVLVSHEDKLVFKVADNNIVIKFDEDKFTCKTDELEDLEHEADDNVWFVYNEERNRFRLVSKVRDVKLIEASHRFKLLLGLYNVKLPITLDKSIFDGDFDTANFDWKFYYDCPEHPITDFYNKLYIVSNQGAPMPVNDDYTPSVLATIDKSIIDGNALIQHFDVLGKPIKIVTNVESLSHLELQVVDFMFQPVIMRSPVFITLKIKPTDKPDEIIT